MAYLREQAGICVGDDPDLLSLLRSCLMGRTEHPPPGRRPRDTSGPVWIPWAIRKGRGRDLVVRGGMYPQVQPVSTRDWAPPSPPATCVSQDAPSSRAGHARSLRPTPRPNRKVCSCGLDTQGRPGDVQGENADYGSRTGTPHPSQQQASPFALPVRSGEYLASNQPWIRIF